MKAKLPRGARLGYPPVNVEILVWQGSWWLTHAFPYYERCNPDHAIHYPPELLRFSEDILRPQMPDKVIWSPLPPDIDKSLEPEGFLFDDLPILKKIFPNKFP